MSMHETVEGVTYDELVGGTEVTAITKNISIEAGNAMKRGTLVTAAGAPVAKGETADAVVAIGCTETDTVITVYVSGMFNREKLIVAEGDTVEAHEAELRDKNIYLTAIQ